MIISFKNKYIYVKTQKVSGTSMEIALSHTIGEKDIVTPLSIDDEIIRYKLTGKTCQNYTNNKKKHIAFTNLVKKLSKKKEIDKKTIIELNDQYQESKEYIFYNHISAKSIKRKIEKNIWNDFFKFAIERHPYDRAISFMYFAMRMKKKFDIKKEIKKTLRIKKYINFSFYFDNNNFLLDKVLKYEDLINEVIDLEKKLNINISKYYIFTKNKHRNKSYTINDILTQEDKNVIYNDCKLEFELMNYEK